MLPQKKTGIRNFSVDGYFLYTGAVARLKKKLGLSAVGALLGLFGEVFTGTGYYLQYGPEDAGMWAERLGGGASAGFVGEVVEEAVAAGIFAEDVYRKYGILTSAELQRQFLAGCRRRRGVEVHREYLLLPERDVRSAVNRGTLVVAAFHESEIRDDGGGAAVDGGGAATVGQAPENPASEGVADVRKASSKTAINKEIDKKINITRGISKMSEKPVDTRILELLPEDCDPAVAKAMTTKLTEWLDYFTVDVIALAIDESLKNNAFNMNYLYKVLKDWRDNDIKTLSQAEKYLSDWKNKGNRKSSPTASVTKGENIGKALKRGKFYNYRGRDWDYEKLQGLADQKMYDEAKAEGT